MPHSRAALGRLYHVALSFRPQEAAAPALHVITGGAAGYEWAVRTYKDRARTGNPYTHELLPAQFKDNSIEDLSHAVGTNIKVSHFIETV